jgi:hypothetical protein
MAKGPMYVKDFDFSVKPCNYSHGGSTTAAEQKTTKMASGGYYAKGGMKQPMKSSRMEMVKARSKPSKAPMRRSVPVAPVDPMIELKAMAKGGAVANGSGMVKTTGSLGIKGNKNPGERNGTPTTATKTGNVAYSHGGDVKKYAGGGPMMGREDKMPRELQQAIAAAFRGEPTMRQPTRGGKSGISESVRRALVREAMRAQEGGKEKQGGMPGKKPMQTAARRRGRQMPPQMSGQMPPQMEGQMPPQMGGQRPGLEQIAAQMAAQRPAPGQMPPQMAARAGGKVSKKK